MSTAKEQAIEILHTDRNKAQSKEFTSKPSQIPSALRKLADDIESRVVAVEDFNRTCEIKEAEPQDGWVCNEPTGWRTTYISYYVIPEDQPPQI